MTPGGHQQPVIFLRVGNSTMGPMITYGMCYSAGEPPYLEDLGQTAQFGTLDQQERWRSIARHVVDEQFEPH